MLTDLALKIRYTFEARRPFANAEAATSFLPRPPRSDRWPRDVAYFDWMRWLWNQCMRTDLTVGTWKAKRPFAAYIRGVDGGSPSLV